jgi:E3 ubiquitin-protein ligase SHPRH
MQVLVDKAKLEAEDAQRSLFGALNGLAGLAIIEDDIPLAVSIYREVLSYTEENARDVRVDPLQKLHTLHNLAEVCEQ